VARGIQAATATSETPASVNVRADTDQMLAGKTIAAR